MSAGWPAREPVVVRVGSLPLADLSRRLDRAGVRLNEHARTLLSDPRVADADPEEVAVVTRTPADLGLPAGGTMQQVFDAAVMGGLHLCPPATGPYLRLALLDQPDAPDSVLSAGRPPTAALHVASAPLRPEWGYPKGFYLRAVDGVPWLRGYRCDLDYDVPADQRYAFVV